MSVSDRGDDGGGGDRSDAGDRPQTGVAYIPGCSLVHLATVPEHPAVQSYELVTEIGHDVPGQVRQVLVNAFKAMLRKGYGVAGALPDNNPKLGQNTAEHIHDLRPLADDQVPYAVQGQDCLLLR